MKQKKIVISIKVVDEKNDKLISELVNRYDLKGFVSKSKWEIGGIIGDMLDESGIWDEEGELK